MNKKWLSFFFAALLSSNVFAEMAIIQQDNTPLRATPRDSGTQQTVMWQGELVEVRGEKLDYLQVYDYQRERGGFVHSSKLRRTKLSENERENYLALLRFLSDQPNKEALGFAYAAAYLKVANAQQLKSPEGAEVFSILGQMADRLALRVSGENKISATALTGHLEVANRYGIKFINFEKNGQMVSCYDGEAYRYVLQSQASPTQRAIAALALSNPDCINPSLPLREQDQIIEQSVSLLSQVDTKELPDYLKNQLYMRRASVLSWLAYIQTRKGKSAKIQAEQLVNDMALVNKSELLDSDQKTYNTALMYSNLNRWSLVSTKPNLDGLHIETSKMDTGEICISLKQKQQELLNRCTYSLVWDNSVSINHEQNAVAFVVQPSASWSELWLMRKTPQGWELKILPASNSFPELGYIELVGWPAGGKQMILARESRCENKYQRRYEVIDLDTLAVNQQSSNPEQLGAIRRWASASWKKMSLSAR